MHPLTNIAIRAARSAGDLILQYSQRLDTIKINEKSRHNYVTEVDTKAEQIIIDIIHKAYPQHAILAEESGTSGDHTQDIVWIIDPLDGTTNFIHGLPHYAVSIAIKVKERIEYGVIYDPIRNELFFAERGNGARLNDKRLRVTQQKDLKHALIGTGFPFRDTDRFSEYLKIFERLIPQAAGIRRAGTATLDLAYVAAGRLDGFWEMGLAIWDMAAGSLLIKEAGGLVGDFNGGEAYFEKQTIVAGNPKIFKSLLQLMN